MRSEKTFGVRIIILAFLVGLSVAALGSIGYTNGQKPAADSTNGAYGSYQPRVIATGVFINQKEITLQQLAQLTEIYRMAPPPGRYWYDSRSGLYGMWGFEAAGYIRPGHEFAALPADASRGKTGVYINGREINLTEALFAQRIFGAVYRGRWWLDGQTGNVGFEGNPMPVANVVPALQQAQRRGGQGDQGYRWRDEINRSSGGVENGCVWVNMPGGSYTGSGC